MNGFSCVILVALVGIGCGNTTPAVAPQPVPAVVVTPPPPPQVVKPILQPMAAVEQAPAKEDRKISVLKEKIAAYLSEARAGSKLLALDPSLEQLKQTAKLITDLYTHLPDVPADLDPKGHVATRLKQINGTFATVIVMSQLKIQAEQLNVDAEKLKEIVIKQRKGFDDAANNLKQFANEIESKLGL